MFFKTVTSLDKLVSTATAQLSTQLGSWQSIPSKWLWSSTLNLTKFTQISNNTNKHSCLFTDTQQHFFTTHSMINRQHETSGTTQQVINWASVIHQLTMLHETLFTLFTDSDITILCFTNFRAIGTEVNNNVNVSTTTTQQLLLLFCQ